MVFLLRCVVDEIGDNKRRNYCQNGSPEKLTKVSLVRTNYSLIKIALRPLPLLKKKVFIIELGNKNGSMGNVRNVFGTLDIPDSLQCVWNPRYT